MTDSFWKCQWELVRLQEGVITRGQALAAGLTAKAVEARLRRGHWQAPAAPMRRSASRFAP